MTIRAVQYGLGPIGCGIARLAARRSGIELVGGVDIDPTKADRDLGEVINLGRPLNIAVKMCLSEALAGRTAEVALHSTGSALRDVWPQIEECICAGLNVVSTCEELAYPTAQHPDLAQQLDRMARDYGVSVLGTGVNPGFAMDALPLFLSGICGTVERLEVRRVLDASVRRLPLQKKIGAGLTVEEFQKLVANRSVRHVGLLESLRMLADGLGWALDHVDEIIEPVIAESTRQGPYFEVPPGHVAGVHQIARGYRSDREVVTLNLHMALGAENPGDYVHIWTGDNELEMTIKGMHGDLATFAMVVNCAPAVIAAPPGLVTMKDIVLPRCWSPSKF